MVFSIFKIIFKSGNLFKIIFILSLCFFSCATKKKNTSSKPNVVLINVDDLGWADLGYMGSKYYDTPNIDKLSKQGMVFRQAYASAANCAPSRANMITGLYGPRHGIYTVGSSERGDPKTRRLIPTPNEESISDTLYTMGEMFQDNGYTTANIGKWHISEDPKKHGFDVNIGGSHRGGPGSKGYFSPYNIDHLKDGSKGEYLTDRLTNEAISFIETNKEKPFFLYLPFYAVHKPLMAKKAVEKFYQKKEPTPGQSNATYAAMIHTMDENVGKLLRTLQNSGLEENTIVIFTSDNGGIRQVSHQDPLRAGKGSYYEGGIRIPLIMKWPGKIKIGVSETPVVQRDLFPTLENLIRAQKTAKNLDAMDITPLLEGNSMKQRDFFWHFPIYLQAYSRGEDGSRDPLFRTRPGSVIRSGNWKLHEYFENGSIELYNLAIDPGEKNDVSKDNPEKADELYQKLLIWRKKTNAPVPTKANPQFDAEYEKIKINKIIKEGSNN